MPFALLFFSRKTPWRLSPPQKGRQRKRLRAVDKVVDTLGSALARQGQQAPEQGQAQEPAQEPAQSKTANAGGGTAAAAKAAAAAEMAAEATRMTMTKAVVRWQTEMPREEEMLPRDKYTIFDRKYRKYRKGIHSMFFFLSTRLLPPPFCLVESVE